MPFEIPENWCWVEMSDIFFLNPKNDINDNVDGGFIPMACVCDGYSGEHTFITKQWGDIKKGFSHFQNGDIGIAKISPCFENRKSVIFSDLPNNIGSGTTELVVLRGIIVNTAFYLLLIKSDWYISEGTKYFKGVVGQQRVHKDIFTTLQVPMPPLREQQKIVDSVKKWFSAIDEIENGATELETVIKQVKSKILDLAVSGKLVPQDPNDEPAIELLRRINPAFKTCDNSHYENLPQGWTIVGLHSVAEIITGSTPSKLNAEYYNGDVPFYKPNDLDQGRHVRCASEYLSQQGKSISRSIPCNSIAVCCIGSIGKCGFIEKEGVTNQQINTIVPNDAIFPLYMYYFCNSSTFIDELKSLSSAVTISIVNKSKLSTIQIPLPPIAEQKRIISVIEKLYSHLDMITAEL